MLVAGIDASTKATGICIMRDGEIISCVFIDLHKEKEPIRRIQMMLLEICKELNKYEIDEVYMEKAFNKQNIDTTQKLANIAGGVMLYCAKNKIKFVHPMPSEWRAKIGIEQSNKIKRETLKAEAISAVQREYDKNVNDDVAESILLARSAFNLPKINITEDDLWGE